MGLANLKISKRGLISPARWNRLVDAVEESMITSFVNGSYRRGKGGTALEGLAPYRGPSLHVMALADFIPDPFAIVGQVMESLTTDLLAAMPSATAIAGVITAPLEAAAGSGTSPGSVVAPVEALFGAAVAVLGTVEERVQDLIADINPVKTALEEYFAGPNRRQPKNGDYIYTEEVGIVYVLFRQNDEGIPSGNTIFRVEFEIEEVTWVAVTTFPAPDIGALIGPIASMAVTLLKSLASAVVDAAVQAVAAGLIALFAALETLQSAVDALASALASMLSKLNALDDIIKDPETGVLKQLADQQGLIDDLQSQIGLLDLLLDDLIGDLSELAGKVSTIEGQLASAPSVDVINTAGYAVNVKVLTAGEPVDVRSPITWIDSDSGAGQSAQMLIWDQNPNTLNVDWRVVDYISQIGDMMKVKVLTLINEGYPKGEAVDGSMEKEDLNVCHNGQPATRPFITGEPEEI